MEKRQQKTLARTLKWVRTSAKLVLIATLFVPGLLLMKYRRTAEEPAHISLIAKKPKPRELVRIYSIVKSNRPDIRDTEAWGISETILSESSGYGVDPMLVLAMIDVESKFQNAAISPAGARGIMQILPYVGRALADSIAEQRGLRIRKFRPENLDDPIFNIKLGVYYLQELKKTFRSVNLALSAYNIGPTEIRARLENNIEFSDKYAAAVLSSFKKFEKIKSPMF